MERQTLRQTLSALLAASEATSAPPLAAAQRDGDPEPRRGAGVFDSRLRLGAGGEHGPRVVETHAVLGSAASLRPRQLLRGAHEVPPRRHDGRGFVLPLDELQQLRSTPRLLFYNEGGERLCAALVPEDAGSRVRLV